MGPYRSLVSIAPELRREYTASVYAALIEDCVALALLGRDELDLVWVAGSEHECRRNRRRFRVALLRRLR